MRLNHNEVDIWELWEGVSLTQWRTDTGTPTGLDYTAVRAIAEALDVPWTPRVILGIQKLEIDYLQELAKDG